MALIVNQKQVNRRGGAAIKSYRLTATAGQRGDSLVACTKIAKSRRKREGSFFFVSFLPVLYGFLCRKGFGGLL